MSLRVFPVLSLILIALITLIESKLLVLPFQKRDTVNPTDKIQEILEQMGNNSCRVEVGFGNPEQKLYLLASTERSYSYVISEDAISFIEEGKYKFYRRSKSSTYLRGEEGISLDDYFITGNIMKEDVRLGDLTLPGLSLVEGQEFLYGFDLPCDSGILGIGFRKENGVSLEDTSLEIQLKARDITTNHYVFIHYTGDGVGKIGIGGEPKEIDNEFNGKELQFVKFPKTVSEVAIGFEINKITYNGEPIYTGIKSGKLSIDYTFIEADGKLKTILDRAFFEKLFLEGTCTSTALKYNYDGVYYYHCKKGAVNKKKLFTLSLYNEEWNKTFDINLQSLFKDYGDRSYFMMSFNMRSNNDKIILGEHFLRNYTFVMDLDKRLLGYYTEESKSAEDEESSFNPTVLIIVLISIAIISVLAFFVYRLWKKQPRKIRGTELQENYEY